MNKQTVLKLIKEERKDFFYEILSKGFLILLFSLLYLTIFTLFDFNQYVGGFFILLFIITSYKIIMEDWEAL